MESKVRIGKAYFMWLRRTPKRTFDNDPRYVRNDMVLEQVIDAALRAEVRVDSIEPKIGWLKKHDNEDYYRTCGEHTDGAIPAWIWTAR